MKRNYFRQIRNSNFSIARCKLTPLIGGIAVLVGCLLLFAVIMTLFDMPDSVVSVMSSLGLCAGCYAAAYLTARQCRRRGLLCGIIVAIGVYIAVFVGGMIFASAAIGMGWFSKLIMLLVCGIIGGVKGVNTKNNGKFN